MRKLILGVAALLVTAPLAAQDYRFTRDLQPGDRLELENINGTVEVLSTTGRTARVEVTKTVRRGDGDLVKALVEYEGRTMRVCTVFLNRDPNRDSCGGQNSLRRGERLDVTTDYVVRVPSGVVVDANTVNGSIVLRGIDTPSSASTVNGNIDFDAAGAHSLETVNGTIRAKLSRDDWRGSLDMETVNGSIELTLPENFAAQVSGETVNGKIESDFPFTIQGRWGPKSFRGTINGGGARNVVLETVNGSITIRKL